MKHDVNMKKLIKKLLPYCGLYVIVFIVLLFGTAFIRYRNIGMRQWMVCRLQRCELNNLLDVSNEIVEDGDGYVTTGSDPCFIVSIEAAPMVDVVLSDLPTEGSWGEFYYADEGETFSQETVQIVHYQNGHNLVVLPTEKCDSIRVDIATEEGVHFEVKDIMAGSPWILYFMTYWKQLMLMSLIIVVLWWCI